MIDIVWTVPIAVLSGLLGWLLRNAWPARRGAAAERERADLANAQTQAAEARAEAAAARAELARSEADVERARAETAAAREQAAGFRADLAAAQAGSRQIELERDNEQARAQELLAAREAMANHYKALSSEALERQSKAAEATAEQRFQATEQLMTPMKDALQRFEDRLIAIEKERVALAADLAAQVKQVRSTGDELRRETAALTTALRKPHVRGAWGEVQLKRVVELAGMVEHCDFAQQATAATDDKTIRPDLKVHLAGGKFVYVDAKVPLTAFLDAQEAADEADRDRHLKAFARNVRQHVSALSAKQYWKADTGTPEFVVLFIPSEPLAWGVLEQAPDLIEDAARKNVVLATPTTLIALLRTVAHAWSQAALADSARDISELGRQLYDRLGTMGSHVDKLGRSLLSSTKSYNEVVASLESRVLVTARRFRDLGVAGDELPVPSPIDITPRLATAPELIEDAARVLPLIGREPRRHDIDADDRERAVSPPA
ncbi:MAG: DNA recombination protein RmuC [Propionibacteriaceae bacterium]|jgi:DNA recombination protein RmuC|nr:DNA recombination protein RmuC [Propionibacteriaceae bacterium]